MHQKSILFTITKVHKGSRDNQTIELGVAFIVLRHFVFHSFTFPISVLFKLDTLLRILNIVNVYLKSPADVS